MVVHFIYRSMGPFILLFIQFRIGNPCDKQWSKVPILPPILMGKLENSLFSDQPNCFFFKKKFGKLYMQHFLFFSFFAFYNNFFALKELWLLWKIKGELFIIFSLIIMYCKFVTGFDQQFCTLKAHRFYVGKIFLHFKKIKICITIYF